MSHLFEMHAHTKEVSRCAHSTGAELAALYENTDYEGIVLTNHLNSSTFAKKEFENSTWEQKAEHFINGYKLLKEALDGKMTVLFGMEICFYREENDYLVYGLTEDFLKNNGDLMELGIEKFSELAHENGLLVVQAHPFRTDMQIADPELLDGYEIRNCNPRHNSRNDFASLWADRYGVGQIKLCGSDFHQPEDARLGGVYFLDEIKSNADLLKALRAGRYRVKE